MNYMKILCKKTNVLESDLTEVKTILSSDFDFSDGGRGLERNKEYCVMGIVIYKDSPCIYYLIDVNGRPDWFPYMLFEVSDNCLPLNWFFNVYAGSLATNLYAIWGFNELCNSDRFYDQLMDREDLAMEIYFTRKREFE